MMLRIISAVKELVRQGLRRAAWFVGKIRECASQRAEFPVTQNHLCRHV